MTGPNSQDADLSRHGAVPGAYVLFERDAKVCPHRAAAFFSRERDRRPRQPVLIEEGRRELLDFLIMGRRTAWATPTLPHRRSNGLPPRLRPKLAGASLLSFRQPRNAGRIGGRLLPAHARWGANGGSGRASARSANDCALRAAAATGDVRFISS